MENRQIKQPLPIPQKLFKTCFWKSPDGNLVEILVPVPLPTSKKEEPLDLIQEKIQNLMPVPPAPFPRAIASVSAITAAPIIVPPSLSKTTNSSRVETTVVNSKCIPSSQIMSIQKIDDTQMSKAIYKTVPVAVPAFKSVLSSNVKCSQASYNKSLLTNQLASDASTKGQIQGRLKGIIQKNLNFTNSNSNFTAVKINSANVLPSTESGSQSILKINNPNTVITMPQVSSVKLLNTGGKVQILQPQGKFPVLKQIPLKNTTVNSTVQMPVKLVPVINNNNVTQVQSINPSILTHSKTKNLKVDPTPLNISAKPAASQKIAFVTNSNMTPNSSVLLNDKTTKLIPLPKLPPGFVYAFQNNPVTVLNMPIIVSPNLTVSSKVNDEKKKEIDEIDVSKRVKIKTEPIECASSDDNANLKAQNNFKIMNTKDDQIITKVKKEPAATTSQNISNLIQNINPNPLLNKINISEDLSLRNKIGEKEADTKQLSGVKHMLNLNKIETTCQLPYQKSNELPVSLINSNHPKYISQNNNRQNICHPSVSVKKPRMIPLILKNNRNTTTLFPQTSANNDIIQSTNKPTILERTLPSSLSDSSKTPLNISVQKPNCIFSTNAYNQQFLKFILHSPSQNKDGAGNISSIIKNSNNNNNSIVAKNKTNEGGKRNLQFSNVIPCTEGSTVSSLNDSLDMFIPEIEIIEEEKTINIPNWSPVKIRNKRKKRRFNTRTAYKKQNKMKISSPEYIKPQKQLRQKCSLQLCNSETSNLLGDCYVVLRPLKMNRIAGDSVNLKELSESELFSDDDNCDLFSMYHGTANGTTKRLKLSIPPNKSCNNMTEQPNNESNRTVSINPSQNNMLNMRIQPDLEDFCKKLMQDAETQKGNFPTSLRRKTFKKEINGEEIQESSQNVKFVALTDKSNTNNLTSKNITPLKRNFQCQKQTPNGNARIHLLKQRLLDALKETEKLSKKNVE